MRLEEVRTHVTDLGILTRTSTGLGYPVRVSNAKHQVSHHMLRLFASQFSYRKLEMQLEEDPTLIPHSYAHRPSHPTERYLQSVVLVRVFVHKNYGYFILQFSGSSNFLVTASLFVDPARPLETTAPESQVVGHLLVRATVPSSRTRITSGSPILL